MIGLLSRVRPRDAEQTPGGGLLRSSRGALVAATAVGALSGLANAGLLALVHRAVRGQASAALPWTYAALCGLVLVASIGSQALLIRVAQAASLRLRLELSRRIVHTPLRRLEELGTPSLLAALTDDILTVSEGLMVIPTLCVNLSVVAGCIIYLAWLSWEVFQALLAFVVIGVVSYQVAVGVALRFLGRARREQDTLYRHLRSLTEGVKELQLHQERRRAFVEEVLCGTAAALRRDTSLGLSVFSLASAWAQLLYFLFVGLLLFALPGRRAVASDAVVGYALIVLYMMAPLGNLLASLPGIGRARVAHRNLEGLGLALGPSEVAPVPPPDPRPAWRCVELAGVTHSYREAGGERSFVLGPIDLTFEPGDLVVLTGGNGSGKTTLAKLLTGLYEPESGEVRLNGKPVTEATRERYRQHFSAVFSDCHLFDRLLGLRGDDLQRRVAEFLVRLGLDGHVRLQDGVLSWDGLSAGQRKRLALLVAWLEDRPIYVFDEWAADQDAAFREVFYRQLLPELKANGKAVLVISHDDRYFQVADLVLKLERGRLQ
jgi:putative pyoverdin transport system ATP-binding/permease protein